jgi:hypothetical protein
LSLTAEFMGIDSENDLFRKLPKNILAKIERSVYNKRRRKLANDLNSIRLKLASAFNKFKTRIIAKITALTTIQYINKFIFDRNINNIKISII